MNFRIWLAAAFLFLTAVGTNAQKITIGTFNVRYDNPRDSGNLWVDRAPIVSNLIRFHEFDIAIAWGKQMKI